MNVLYRTFKLGSSSKGRLISEDASPLMKVSRIASSL